MPKGQIQVVSPVVTLQEPPMGQVKPVTTPPRPQPVILSPEEDPDGLSVAGMDNSIGFKFL
jgi:hypothetical protein